MTVPGDPYWWVASTYGHPIVLDARKLPRTWWRGVKPEEAESVFERYVEHITFLNGKIRDLQQEIAELRGEGIR